MKIGEKLPFLISNWKYNNTDTSNSTEIPSTEYMYIILIIAVHAKVTQIQSNDILYCDYHHNLKYVSVLNINKYDTYINVTTNNVIRHINNYYYKV